MPSSATASGPVASAQAAVEALGGNYYWPGWPDWNVTSQVPVLHAVIALDTSLDPAVPGRTLMKGESIEITLPKAFTNKVRQPVKTVFTEGCAPREVECNSGVQL